METILSSLIAVAVTLFFLIRHVKAMPPARPAARPARRKAPSAVAAASREAA